MTKFLWASAHTPTSNQMEDLNKQGTVKYLKEINPDLHKQLVSIKLDTDLSELAKDLLNFCIDEGFTLVQPAGNPAFMVALGRELGLGLQPDILFSFSERVSKDIPQEDGTVKKISIFNHLGWQ